MDFGSVNGGGASIHFYVFREDAYGTGKPFMCFGCLGVDSCHSGIHSLDEYLCVSVCPASICVLDCICSDLYMFGFAIYYSRVLCMRFCKKKYIGSV